jgi:hypothetical protein
MLYLKIFLQVGIGVTGLLAVLLDYKWHDKRKRLFKRTRNLLISLSILLVVAGSTVTVLDERQKNEEILSLNSQLKSIEENGRKLNNKQDSLKSNYDSLLHSYLLSQMMLSDANLRIESLLRTTEKGFKENKDAINDIEKITVKDARTISTKDEDRLIQDLSKGKGSKVEFGTINTSDESIILSGQLQSIFKRAGWTVTEERWLAPDSKYVGIFMFVNQNKQHEHALLVYNSVKSLNFDFQAIDAPNFDATRLKIVVGFKK